jgi:periplasmic protein TonB
VVAPPPPRVATTNRIYGPEDTNVLPPIVVRQSFAPLADVFAVHAGIVEVVVDELGEVVAVKTVVTVNPAYDRLALATARSWRYRPATLDGAAVKYRTIVQLPLKSR